MENKLAVTYNTTIDQGADWLINFIYEQPAGVPVNITNYTAALQIRTSPMARTTVLSLTNGQGITVYGGTGTLAVHATAAQTNVIPYGKYTYDIEITSPQGIVTRIAQGTIQVSPQVTRTP